MHLGPTHGLAQPRLAAYYYKAGEPWPTALGGGARSIPSMAGDEGVGVGSLSGSGVRGINLGVEMVLKEAQQCYPRR
jgi:hypothetical protein